VIYKNSLGSGQLN